MKNKGKDYRAAIFFASMLAGTILFSVFSRSQNLTAQPQASLLTKADLTPQLFSRGEAVYKKQCASCHGDRGGGDGKAAYLLYPKPRDFTRGEFRLISTTDMTARDADLFKTITRGIPGSAMPPWEFLPEADRWGLVYYVRYLMELGKKKAGGEITDEKIQSGLPWDEQKALAAEQIDPEAVINLSGEPAVTQEGLARGRELFVKGCAACHGLEGKGDGKQIMMDSQGFPLKPRDLTAGIFKASGSSEDLYYRMVAGLPGTPMPSYQYAYKPEEIWDMIHYVQTLPKPDAGEHARLSQQSIAAKKVKEDLTTDPAANFWKGMDPVFVVLTPLWWRNDRIEGVEVRAAYNSKQIAIHLSWADPAKEDSQAAPQLFSDGAAIQFSPEKDPPFFAMGSKDSPVTLWHWKAVWQRDLTDRDDIETRYPNAAVDWYKADTQYKHGEPFEARDSKTQFHDPDFLTGWGAKNPVSDPGRSNPAEAAVARGFGSYTAQSASQEKVESRGIWKDGKWQVVFTRSLRASEKGGLQFSRGKRLSAAFAIWDGTKEDRNGQKMVSIWNHLTLEK